MNWLITLVGKIEAYLRSWISQPYKTALVAGSLPRHLKQRVLYIVEEDGFQEQAAMVCPCGCGRVLHMNLLPDERPCWRVTQHSDGTSTLHPSVWRTKDCRSHFWFKRGYVHWAINPEAESQQT